MFIKPTPTLKQKEIKQVQPAEVVYKYKYNGKELQDELGLNWYDYGARNYDVALGRWFSSDPLSEEFPEWTPYNYAMNNPMRYVDLDGRKGDTDFIILETGDRVHVNDNKDQMIAVKQRDFSKISDSYQNGDTKTYNNELNKLENSNYNLHMTTSEYNEIAGTIINEASVKGPWEESAAIYSVLRNRSNEDNKTILEECRSVIGGVAGNSKWENIKKSGYSFKRMNRVNKGITMAIVTGHDYSNGAYWWDGSDYSRMARYLGGTTFTNKSHNIYNLKENARSGSTIYGSWNSKYMTTAAYGGTIFSRLTMDWRNAQGNRITRWDGTF